MDSVAIPDTLGGFELEWMNQLTLRDRLTTYRLPPHQKLLSDIGRADVKLLMYEGGPGYAFVEEQRLKQKWKQRTIPRRRNSRDRHLHV